MITEGAVWPTFVHQVGRNSSVALWFPLHIPYSGGFLGSLLLRISVTAKQTVHLRSDLCRILGPSWVLLLDGHQIYQPWISPCIFVETSEGKQTYCLPCPLPSLCKGGSSILFSSMKGWNWMLSEPDFDPCLDSHFCLT